jgi:solute:Na+ symporter, SSS family
MTTLDWLVVGAYMIATLAIGIWLARRASGSIVDFFVGGRSFPWWLAGTSMAATTFSIDTPLYVAGVVGERGIAGNWEWWGYGITHVIMIYVFARLWRRAEIVTDNELSELRYSGLPAAVLRATKGFLFAVVIGSIGTGYAMLAMVKVVDALQVFPSLGLDVGNSGKLWAIIVVSVFVLIYAGVAGLWGVAATDFFQFFLALFGALLVAWFAVTELGGLGEVARLAQQNTDLDVLAFTPFTFGDGAIVRWSQQAGISALTFFSYVAILWWAFRRSDGGGEFIQRLSAVRDEREAERAAWFFNIMHYVVRTWPWIIVALAAIALYPELEDRQLGYPKLMLDFLPKGVLGLVVASLFAAFMSTVSTLINWSASYMTNDLYARFLRPHATQQELVAAARVASVIVTAIAGVVVFHSDSILKMYRLVLAIGTGPGLVLILRWYWWRINAWAEFSAMVSGFVIGLFLMSRLGNWEWLNFGHVLTLTAIGSLAIWIPAMLVTKPEPDSTLDSFYTRVRPGGPGWRRQRARTGIAPAQDLGRDALRVLAGIMLLFGSMFAIGGVLLQKWPTALVMGAAAIGGYVWLRAIGPTEIAPARAEAPTHPGPARRS